MRKADHHCCLTVAGSINSPLCAVLMDRSYIVGSNCISRGDYANYCKGKGIREIMEDELDTIIDRLMTPGSEAADGLDKGRGESLAWALAVIENPYAPNMDKIKGEAMLRYEEKLREATLVQCSANIGGDPASGCDDEATGEDGLCDEHRATAAAVETDDVPWHDMRTASEAAAAGEPTNG